MGGYMIITSKRQFLVGAAATALSARFARATSGVVIVSNPPFNAKGDGVNDDTAAIQAAINSLPEDGGIVLFPPPPWNSRITSTLQIGDGTTSSPSTRRGVILRGLAMPNTPSGAPFYNGYTPTSGPKLTWGGPSWSNMILINGPLNGWGIENLFLDGGGVAPMVNGLQVISASFGAVKNLTIQGCLGNSIVSFSNPLSGYSGRLSKADSLRNMWADVFVLVPASAGAKGILLTGATDGSSDTDYNEFHNVFLRSAGPSQNFGLYLGVCDANSFFNLSASGFNFGSGAGMQFDYGINSNFPGSNMFFAYEIDSFVNSGNPGPYATPNQFYAGITANGAPPPNLPNTIAR